MQSVVMLSVTNKSLLLSAIMLSVIMLNVVMLSVVAPGEIFQASLIFSSRAKAYHLEVPHSKGSLLASPHILEEVGINNLAYFWGESRMKRKKSWNVDTRPIPEMSGRFGIGLWSPTREKTKWRWLNFWGFSRRKNVSRSPWSPTVSASCTHSFSLVVSYSSGPLGLTDQDSSLGSI